MKKIFILCAGIAAMASAQVQVDSIRAIATTSWQKVEYTTQAVRAGYIINDGANDSDSIAFSACVTVDTAAANRHKIKKGETASFSNKPIKSVWYKSLSGSNISIRLCVSNAPIMIEKAETGVAQVALQYTSLTPLAPNQVIVDTISSQILAADASRKSLVITNISGYKVSLGLNSSAVRDQGIVLAPNERWNMNEFSYYTGVINAIAETMGCKLAIQVFQ